MSNSKDTVERPYGQKKYTRDIGNSPEQIHGLLFEVSVELSKTIPEKALCDRTIGELFAFKEYLPLVQRGVPDVRVLVPDEKFSPQERRLLMDIRRARGHNEATLTGESDICEREHQLREKEVSLRQQHLVELTKLYQAHYGLSNFEAQQWIRRQPYTIFTLRGLPVFTFMISAGRGPFETDILQLEARVREKSREFGV